MKFYLFILSALTGTVMATPKPLQDVDGSVLLTPCGPFPCEGCVSVSILFVTSFYLLATGYLPLC